MLTARPYTAALPWLLALVVLVLVGWLGVRLMVADADASGRQAAPDPTPVAPSPSERGEPDPAGASDPVPEDPEPTPEPPRDLARFATVDAPTPAPPSRDGRGNAVRYEARQMVDGVAETAWRTPGDATGATLKFSFDRPVVVTSLGLVNGYAKVGQDANGPLDWYHGNRRVLAVAWVLDDGTTVRQDLDDTTVVQEVRVRRSRTTSVQLRLLEVSPPGSGRASRDYTAISDVRIVGRRR